MLAHTFNQASEEKAEGLRDDFDVGRNEPSFASQVFSWASAVWVRTLTGTTAVSFHLQFQHSG
jgi:hypothetical protein